MKLLRAILSNPIYYGYFKYNDPDDGKSWAVATYVNDLPDLTGIRSESEQNTYLMKKYARYLAHLFNGTTTYTFQHVDAGTVVTAPKISSFEIFFGAKLRIRSEASTPEISKPN